MSKFPSGNFTITNDDTGRCLRARLGSSEDLSYHSEGMKYLLSRTGKPQLELGPADDSAACAWYLDTTEQRWGKGPANQIVSTAVRDLQNIGDFCVAAVPDPDAMDKDWDRLTMAANNRTSQMYQRYLYGSWTGSAEKWEKLVSSNIRFQLVSAEDLLDPEQKEEIEERWFSAYEDEMPEAWIASPKALIDALWAYGLEHTSQPLDLASYDDPANCPDPYKVMTLAGTGIEFGYYRWSVEGNHIRSTDDLALSYWTDEDGELRGRDKGRPGQNWTITPWTPPKVKQSTTTADLIRTGLFGPFAALLDH